LQAIGDYRHAELRVQVARNLKLYSKQYIYGITVKISHSTLAF